MADLNKNQGWDHYTETSLLLDDDASKRRKFHPKTTSLRFRLCIGISVLLLLIAGVCVGVGLALTLGQTHTETSSPYTRQYSNAAVATDSAICSEVGANLMRESGGNAIDAAIGSLFCLGVVQLQSTGIGGGGFMTIYNGTSKETYAIDFREKAPAVISEEAMERYLNDPTSTTQGEPLPLLLLLLKVTTCIISIIKCVMRHRLQ